MSLTTDEVINLLGTLASVFVAFAALFTILELRAQRRDAHHPEITPVRQLVEGKKPDDSGTLQTWPINWHEPDETNVPQNSGRLLDYRIRLHNIGNGPAKNVTVTWDYPVPKLIQELNQVCQQGNQDFHLELGEMFISLKSIGGKKDGSFSRTVNMSSLKEYILPSSIEKQPTAISVPLAFILLNSICASLVSGTGIEPVSPLLELTGKIGLHIEYYDTLNAKYISSFQCNLDHQMISDGTFFGELRFDRA